MARTSKKASSGKETHSSTQAQPEASASTQAQPAASENPLEKMARMWMQGAQAYNEAVLAFHQTAMKAVEEQRAQGASGETTAVADLQVYYGTWMKAMGSLAGLQEKLVEGWLKDLPEATRTRLDSATFSQLGRLASGNWEDELRRAVNQVPGASPRLTTSSDPERMQRLLEGMAAEYMKDLQALTDSALAINLKPLSEAMAKVLSNQDDPQAKKIVDRFLEALAVKARYGVEYFADPATTPVGQTPRQLINTSGPVLLYRYTPPAGAPPRQGAPLLIVPSIINTSYILDLMPGYSFVEHLLAAGLDVYMIEWGAAKAGDRTTTLDSYIDPGIAEHVELICRRTEKPKVALFGQCLGGNLAVLYAAMHPERVDRLMVLTMPATAAEGGVVAVWTDKEVFPLDRLIDTFGLMPAKLIRYTFISLKPYLEVQKWKLFLETLGSDPMMRLFMPVDRWANDNQDIPGEVFRKLIKEVLLEGRFIAGQTEINGQAIELKRITCPVLNLAAGDDWIVTPRSAEVFNEAIGTPPEQRRFDLIPGPHVAIMYVPTTRPYWTTISDFLREAKTAQ